MKMRVPVRIQDCTATNLRTSRAPGAGQKKKKPPITFHVDMEELSIMVTTLLHTRGIVVTQKQRGIIMAVAVRAASDQQDVTTAVLWECELMDVSIVDNDVIRAIQRGLTIVADKADYRPAALMTDDDRKIFLESRAKRLDTDSK